MNAIFFKVTGLFILILALGVFATPVVQGKVLFQDDFEDGKIDGKYVKMNHEGKWEEKDGIIQQTDPAPGDHTYLIMPGDFPEPHAAIVKVRVDDWEDHDLSRTGLGVRLGPVDGAGYAFLIHHTLSNMEFLNDHITWKNNDTPPPFGKVEIGEWYWMKAEISDKGFNGKIWHEEEDEPKEWLLESALDFGAVRAVSGRVGLNGGSNAGAGKTLVSFDNFAVCEKTEECTPDIFAAAVEPKGKLATTWGFLKR